ncbi:MAG: M48 family metallopeptidase [Firmicutes bacterium]|nr:M48 family metallopeptidase [Bacillota bacterium]
MKSNKYRNWVAFLIVFVLVGLFPVATEATALIGDNFERTLGSGAIPDLIQRYGGEYILPIQQRMWVDEIFGRLVAVTQRDGIEYTLTVLNSHEANAFALPGGYVFITRGLLSAIGSDEAKLAAVLGHELAHVEKKHGVNAVLRQMGMTVLFEVGVMAMDFLSADVLRLASATLVQLVQLGLGREAEYEADLLGQSLAVAAGFDPIGAIALLDELEQADSEDLPIKVFRTHPDMIDRRNRLEANLVNYWSEPRLVTDEGLIERLNARRNYDQNGRSDPKGRYIVENLTIYDQQTGQNVNWIKDVQIVDYAWSSTGDHLAMLVDNEDARMLWIYDRFGHLARTVDSSSIQGHITEFSWSSGGKMLAVTVLASGGEKIFVTHVDTEAFALVSRELSGKNSIWMDQGLYFIHDGQWYHTLPPQVQPVNVANPVPQVLQRKRILSPTVIKEGNTIRLTRPALTLP